MDKSDQEPQQRNNLTCGQIILISVGGPLIGRVIIWINRDYLHLPENLIMAVCAIALAGIFVYVWRLKRRRST